MSYQLQDQFWDVDGISSTDLLVGQRLAKHADESGRCWPSIATLAAGTRLSERTVQTSLKRLEDGDHIERSFHARGVVYLVHPRSRCTPAADAPPQQMHPAQEIHPVTDDAEAIAPDAGDDDGALARVRDLLRGETAAPRKDCTPAADAPDPRSRCTQKDQGKHQELLDGDAGADVSAKVQKRWKGMPPPAGVSDEQWQGFVDHRRAKRETLTPRAYKLICTKLGKLAEAGWPPGELVDTAVERGWTSVFPPRDQDHGQRNRQNRSDDGPRDTLVAAAAARVARGDREG